MSVHHQTHPPLCNTGGTPLAPPGGTPGEAHKTRSKTIIDTVSFSIPMPGYGPALEEVTPIATNLLVLFPGCEWSICEAGKHGYPYQTKLLSGSLICGWLAFGARHNKAWFYVTGTGLRVRRDRGCYDAELSQICQIDGSKLTRVDIALDLYSHEHFNVDDSLSAYDAGGYKLPNAPQSPRDSLIQSKTNNDEYPVARTHYVGKSKGTSKYVRCYDKGLQVLGTLTPEELVTFQTNGSLAVIRSSPVPLWANIEQWTRVELVYMHDKRRPIPAEMLLLPDEYFAGAYPILAELLLVSDGVRPSYIPREEEVELARLMKACRESYGGLFYFLKHERGFDEKRIFDDLCGEKSAARLMVDLETPSGGGMLQ